MIESIAWAALRPALNVRWKWYLCGFWSIFSTFPNHQLFFPLFAPFHDITFISHAKVHDIIPIAWNQITRVHFSSYLDFVFASFSLVAFFVLVHSLLHASEFFPFLIVFIVFHIASHFRSVRLLLLLFRMKHILTWV